MARAAGEITVPIELDRIDTRPASIVRASFNEEQAERYAETIDDMPPLRILKGPEDVHWLIDGFHRYQAHRATGKTRARCVIEANGTYLDAYRLACRANDRHGIPTTNADKRHRVEVALKHPEMSKWSQRAIAEACGVSQPYVSKLDRRSTDNSYQLTSCDDCNGHTSTDPAPPKRVGRDGKTYRVPKKAAPRLEPEPEPVAPEPEPAPPAKVTAPALERRRPEPRPVAEPVVETLGEPEPEPEPEPESDPTPSGEVAGSDPEAWLDHMLASISQWLDALPDDDRRSLMFDLYARVRKIVADRGLNVREEVL